MVLNAYNYVWNQNATKPFAVPKKDECVKTVSQILGISTRSVYRILKEEKENVQLSNRKKSLPKLTFKDKIDDFDFSAIRRKVHQFFCEKDPPTIAKVHQVVNDDPNLPNMSKSTMRAVLKHLKFKYGSRKRRSCLTDRHTTGKVWVDTTIESSKQAFSKGLTTGLKSPTGKDRRLIISHIGSDEGFVEAGLLIFESKKNSMDYHEELNSECFEEWFKSILPNLKPNAVLVLDNAPYLFNSRKVEHIPT
ncbi:hypothetical protein evm_010588 [Chilo suppressalis]|nr:hypothetical protein evm_010588 [Chilo suppressalis]